MTCEEARIRLLEDAWDAADLDVETARHASGCQSCAAWRRTQQELTRDLRALAGRPVPRPKPDAEAALRNELRRRRFRRAGRRLAFGFAAAAAAALAFFAPVRESSPPETPPGVTTADPFADFYVLDYAVLAQPPRGSLVRVTLTPEATQYFGLPPLDASVRGVRADVWLSRDGFPQAVRLLEPVTVGGLD